MESIKKYFLKCSWVWIFVFTVPAFLSILIPGLYGVHDEMHVAWLYEMDRTVKMGQFPPRFVPDLSFGFGYPLFNFVFPLPFYLAEIFHFLNFTLVDSIKIVFLLSLPLSSLFMYKLLREFTNVWISILGGVLYSFTPYRAVDIYVRGAIGEVVSFVFLPLIALSVIKLTDGNGKSFNVRWMGIGAISLACLILSHNITAYMFIPFIVLLAILRILFGGRRQFFLTAQLIISVIFGLLSSAYFWLPALLDSKLVQYDTVYNFIDHFPTLQQLYTPFWGYGASVPGPYDGMSFFLGIVNIMAVIFGIIFGVLFWKKYSPAQKIILVWAFISFFIAIFMTNFRSGFIWEKVPMIAYFQFPWRFLIITTFTAPVLLITLEKLKYNFLIAIILICGAILLNWNYFQGQSEPRRFDAYYINRYIPVPKATEAYFTIGEEYLRLPQTTKMRPEKNYDLVTVDGDAAISVTNTNALNSVIAVSSAKQILLNYNKYYFLGWVAELDKKPVEIIPGDPFGQITVLIPKGSHEIKITYTETDVKKILDIISLLSLTFVLLIIARFPVFKIKRSKA